MRGFASVVGIALLGGSVVSLCGSCGCSGGWGGATGAMAGKIVFVSGRGYPPLSYVHQIYVIDAD